ncbi:endonuclease domain-containing protein [Microbacterium sp. cf046]|uniref:endonuclease domain-containing protein n=1 Tax=Microbacterium sp. cf046 TaxID=1761803 RepID=UPI0015872DF1|nr:DUF559 domain-containing protein [Microbacterium sp. cf046]
MNPLGSESVFLVGDARRAGHPRRWIDGGQFDRPYRGVRALHVDDGGDQPHLQQRTAIVRAALVFAAHMHPAEYFSHTTAAIMWELPLPLLPDAQPHVSVPGRAPRIRGIHGHQIDPALSRVVEHPTYGVRVADAATTWAMLGGMLRHPYDLVALGDAVVRVPRIPGHSARIERDAWGTLADLEAAVHAGRRRGASPLREALARIRPGVASRMETWVRLIVIDAGLPEPVTDHDVFDRHGGFVGCVDLAYPELRIAIEYEGDQHRTDQRQWHRDIEKHERLADLGWRVIRVSRDQVFRDPASIAQRVRRAIDAAR